MDVSRYAELFLTESQEHLQVINDALLELERSGFDPAVIDRFFRSVHTIKGMSATMGYTAVAQLTHDMESLLGEVRDGSRALDPEMLDALFLATDVLERSVGEYAAGRPDSEIDVRDALAAITASRDSETTGARGGDQRSAALRRTGEFQAIAAPSDGIRVEVRLRKDTPLPGVRAFLIIEKLRSLGDVSVLHPTLDEMQGSAFDGLFIAALRTDTSHESIRTMILTSGDVDFVLVGAAADIGTPLTASAPDAQSAPRSSVDADKKSGTRHIRVEQRRLDALMNLAGELVIAKGRLLQRAEELGDSLLDDALAGVARQISDLQDEIMASRMVPVWQIFDRFPRLVRDAARALDKRVDFVMEGREIELDRSLLDEIGDPIVHLLRNAVDHGIESPEQRVAAGKGETGRLVLSAVRDREAVLISVSDDGRGIDREKILAKARAMQLPGVDANDLTDEQLFAVISTSGFSTADKVTDISGRGVGVDAVVTRVRSLGGNIEMRTAAREGTTVTIRLPLTLAIIRAMLARAGNEIYALPLTHVAETVEVDTSAFRTVRGRPVTVLRDEVLPLLRLRQVVELPAASDDRCQMVVLEVGTKRAGLIVDDLVGQQEIVVKQFDAVRSALSLFSGATILGNGEPALIVDVGSII